MGLLCGLSILVGISCANCVGILKGDFFFLGFDLFMRVSALKFEFLN